MQGKTVLITGGNAGIGKATAFQLAEMGAKVTIACRNLARSERVAKQILQKTGNQHIDVIACDLADFASIEKAVCQFKKQHDHLDILINNAGIFTTRLKQTTDGFEMQFGVNHLGHFLLTRLLLGRLKAAFQPRVINVSSAAHYKGKIDFQSFRGENQPYSGLQAYAQSKLANVLFTKEIAKRHPSISCNCLHPGVVRTDIGTKNARWSMSLIWMMWKPFMCTPERGAKTSVYLASSPMVKGISGKYFDQCQRQIEPAPLASDNVLAQRLWEASESFTGA